MNLQTLPTRYGRSMTVHALAIAAILLLVFHGHVGAQTAVQVRPPPTILAPFGGMTPDNFRKLLEIAGSQEPAAVDPKAFIVERARSSKTITTDALRRLQGSKRQYEGVTIKELNFTPRRIDLIDRAEELPSVVMEERWVVENCTALLRPFSGRFKVSAANETIATVTRAIDSRQETKVSLGGTVGLGEHSGIQANKDLLQELRVSLSESSSDRKSRDFEGEETQDRTIAPWTRLYIHGTRTVSNVRYKLRASVVITGSITAHYYAQEKKKDSWGRGYFSDQYQDLTFTIEEVWPNEADRTVYAELELKSGTATRTSLKLADDPVTEAQRPACLQAAIDANMPILAKHVYSGAQTVSVLQPTAGNERTSIMVDGVQRASTAMPGTRKFNVEGRHTCQSAKSIGHQCTNRTQSLDCINGHAKLKADNCCARTKLGGSSIGFKVTKCSAFT